MKDFSKMKMKELVEFHNSVYPDKPVKKFANQATGVKRCEAAQADLKKNALSNGVKKSWADPDVRARRSQRHAAKVDGVEYSSLQAAYRELGLDMKDHRAHRIELKASKKPIKRDGRVWELFER